MNAIQLILWIFVVVTDGFLIRPATVADAPIVADLLTGVFEKNLPWWEFPERSARRSRYERHIRDRITRGPLESHMAVVAISPGGSVVGFVEAGLLPMPPGFVNQPATLTQGNIESIFDKPDDRKTVQTNDAPYIANLCVADNCLRRGLGRRLVDVASTWARDEGSRHVFVGVDSDNTIARRLYENMRFELVGSPDDYSSRRRVYYFLSLAGADVKS